MQTSEAIKVRHLSLDDLFPGLSATYTRAPNGNKNESHTKKGSGRVHQQGKKKKVDR